ncbi:SDR family oxidoreductase [Pseudomonas sp. NFACC13-1]|uniref:SDR family oxidoreductase n=1 Tax=Pseudomonas sp. NFACC13-1 TaxID=1566245 RepID=UPI00088732BA|nr:SDR family oxidoreductase [Pseudomonas sp. NFACC13-1]SDB39559.1 Short-chain dehydrogenase [Pseudomonas sp. NFACC13-1]
MKTVLITGCSSGFGLATTRYFLEHNWKVIATMRSPNERLFEASEHLRVLALDVTDPSSIQQVIEAVGPIDVLVNNAGIGLLGALEGISMEAIRSLFETNTFGTMAMIQAVLPQFRQRRSGVVINVTSSVTIKSLPLLSIYTASKAAVNAFTESLALELEPFNVRVNLVLPGRAPSTDFGKNAQPRMQGSIPEAYSDLAQQVFAEWSLSTVVTEAQDVVEAIWRAANDPASPMRIVAGADAVALESEQSTSA